MGAVQKLATAVIVGLAGLATLLVVYLADEPNRRAAEAHEQEEVAIERGVQTFIQNCVVCHGPAGEGYSEPGAKGTGRIGMPLGGSTELGLKATENNQNMDDPVHFAERTALIKKTLNNGRGLMPAFGTGADGGELLNAEQISELALMIQHVDWDDVYNQTVEKIGGYPTFPPAPMAAAAKPASTPAPGDAAASNTGASADTFVVTSQDIYFDPKEFSIPADADVTLSLVNAGAAPHNFSIDALKISQDQAPGETHEVSVKAAAGDYEYYCNVPGHKEAGMVGKMTADPNMKPTKATDTGEPAAADGAAAPAGEVFTITSHDIYFEPKELAIPAATDVKLSLPNEGAAPHNFAIDALKISQDLAPGDKPEITVNAPAGEYEYYCNVPGHKEAGMVGVLTADPNMKASAAPAAAPADGAATPEAAAAAPAAESFAVVAQDILFEPKELSIPAGKDVVIALSNGGAAPHNFAVDALKISQDLAPGESFEVKVNAPAGDYEYYCNVPGHKEAGMVGKLTAK